MQFDKTYFSEVDDYAIKVYKKHFPQAIELGDIRKIDYGKLPKGKWYVSGGFPCQPHSVAGKRKAGNDERDLWDECKRMLCDLRPSIALFENVPGLLSSDGGLFFNRLLSEIYESGYDAQWQVISAASIGAPHVRKRVWIVCSPMRRGCEWEFGRRAGAQFTDGYSQLEKDIPYTAIQRLQKGVSTRKGIANAQRHCGWAVEPCVGRVAYGIPKRVDRIRVLGNSIVPQIAEYIWRLIKDREENEDDTKKN